ncbi:MAG: methionyl aminopeptidase [Gemmatimonadetes bacterium]|nr:methionyl aminopeptidase [Gemmatimonadota bacterium]
MIQLKSTREIELMADGGRILAATVAMLRREVKPGMSTLDLDTLAESFIRSHRGATPAFKGLYGFPGTLCTSINNEIVHGIPSRKRVLKEGDIISIDVGVGYEGYYTDSATTVHLGDIGAAVQQVVEEAGFSVVRDLVGHGIGVEFHEEPQVPNYGKPKRGLKLVPGLTLAIEPMVNIGGPTTRTLPDKWTIVTVDGSRSAHFEHTVAITESGHRVLTAA